jgi:DNA-directed RNA polymerase subunit RPC12/RpoP
MIIKKSYCKSCGAPKINLSATAYIFCDYCAVLIDWDLKKSCEDSMLSESSKEYEKLAHNLKPALEESKASKNRDKYRKLQEQLVKAQLDAYPKSYSPRIGDPEYRKKFIHYTAEQNTEIAFTEILSTLEKAYLRSSENVTFQEGSNQDGALVEKESFWKMFESYERFILEVSNHNKKIGLINKYPDLISFALYKKLALSVFVQGWFSYLSEEDRKSLLDITGLGGEYIEIEKPETHQKKCGMCGAVFAVVKNAQKSICEHCGYVIDITALPIQCPGCSNYFSFPVGKSGVNCPSCDGLIQILKKSDEK